MAVRWALGCSVFSGRTLCVWLALLTVWRGPRQTGELCTGGRGEGASVSETLGRRTRVVPKRWKAASLCWSCRFLELPFLPQGCGPPSVSLADICCWGGICHVDLAPLRRNVACPEPIQS